MSALKFLPLQSVGGFRERIRLTFSSPYTRVLKKIKKKSQIFKKITYFSCGEHWRYRLEGGGGVIVTSFTCRCA